MPSDAPDPWLLDRLVCPVDRTPLRPDGPALVSGAGRRYPVVQGVPVLLPGDVPSTLWVADQSRQSAADGVDADPYHVDAVGVSPDEAAGIRALIAAGTSPVDPVVSYLVAATNGIAYKHLVGRLTEYPIPALRLPPGEGKRLLDVGCNWGRWCVAAARKGYRPVGIDPSLGAVLAARRVATRLGLAADFVVGDARHLPFRPDTFDVGFSYSVIQHFPRADAARAVAEIGRVLAPGGTAFVQMPTVLGLRCLYHQAKRRFREPADFDVRYYTVPALKRMFEAGVGPTKASVDCFFGIGLQPTDLKHMTFPANAATVASEGLRFASKVMPPLTYLADSVYLTSRKPG